ncbi:RHS repeat domain-containing protein [Pseudomonas fluorescens]|uniref:RHS repeat domain-containing protein n=1 Tax=Pseudomonas fluorescens TaxID=294 RepID=UPI0005FADB41|nr:RHS repeat-associated core domain-containing protein [Pseudomonas fluorescens]KJZ37871.1 toxin [Pseudomonas fluorescens]
MHYKTPTVSVVDPRKLPILSIDYWREVEGEPTQARINRTLYNAAGHAIMQWDPRLWELREQDPLAPANLVTAYSLSDVAVSTLSVDAGLQIKLLGLANEVLQSWDSRGTRRQIEYDDLLRPVAEFEHLATAPRRCAQRLEYARPGQGHNRSGQLIRQDGPGGTVLFESFGVTGLCIRHIQHFTEDAVAPDWPQPIAERNEWLEAGDGAVSTWRFGPLGNVLASVDARQNSQAFGFTLDGRLRQSALKLAGLPTWQTLVSDIEYNADGQITREVAGNDVQTVLTYSPQDGRLIERRAHSDRAGLLQHLSYTYDRMGNVLSIEDKALPVRYFNNQRIEPVGRFVYDSLYQLIEAFGWEAGAPNQGPESIGRTDPAAFSNYHQTCRYDESGNLLKLVHVGAQSPGRDLKAAQYSNRCLPWRNGVPPTEVEIATAFDANGNLLELDPGRFLKWDLRNQLQSVSPVERDSGRNDAELYFYDGGGQRVRKIRSLQSHARSLVAEVRYLPGLELRTNSGTGEVLHVVTTQAGLNTVRVLHWESDPPSGSNDQYRYNLVDHLGSCTVELSGDAQIISREIFYPFGETAWFAGGDAIDVDYKTVRYSGKERDATGLYYYGFRYYIPWLQRWLSPDPAGEVDGHNLYRMVRNNPLTFFDEQGKEPQSKTSLTTATGIFEAYKEDYNDVDRQLPFKMMAEITGNKLTFKTNKAPAGVLEKTSTKRFTLRHYTVFGSKGDAPPFMEIASNFSLVHKNVKTLGGKGGNTNEKDWTKAGNSAFTFFLLAVDGEVNERKFLGSMTHFAEFDLEDDVGMKAALGADFENVEFFASPDVLDPKHSSDLSKVAMVKGRLMDLKALLLGNSGISPVQVGRMDSKSLLNTIDNAFGGSLEIKIPGSINVKTWHKKNTMPAVGKKAA